MGSERALLVAAGGGIGDTLLAGVVARALRARYAAVDAVVLPAHLDLAAHVPPIERTVELGAPLPARYDAAVVTWATLRTAVVPWRARIPVRVGQARRLYSPLFTKRVVVRSELGDRTSHWTDILLDYTRAIGCDAADTTPAFSVRDDERAAAEALLRARGVGFVALAKRLMARDGVPVLVTGSPDDAAIAQAVADGAGSGVTSVAGATPIGAFGALAERARAVIAMDSGPMHVAAALGAPTVGIFALQSDEPDRWAPKGPRVALVRPTYPCPPGHRKETCPDFACVRALDESAVLAALDGLLVATAER